MGYGYEGEKSTMYLANVVIECQRDGDVVIKDRTGTYPEASSQIYSNQNLVSNRSHRQRTNQRPNQQRANIQYGQNLHRNRIDFRTFLPEEQRDIKNISEILESTDTPLQNVHEIESDSLAAYKAYQGNCERTSRMKWGGKQTF